MSTVLCFWDHFAENVSFSVEIPHAALLYVKNVLENTTVFTTMWQTGSFEIDGAFKSPVWGAGLLTAAMVTHAFYDARYSDISYTIIIINRIPLGDLALTKPLPVDPRDPSRKPSFVRCLSTVPPPPSVSCVWYANISGPGWTWPSYTMNNDKKRSTTVDKTTTLMLRFTNENTIRY